MLSQAFPPIIIFIISPNCSKGTSSKIRPHPTVKKSHLARSVVGLVINPGVVGLAINPGVVGPLVHPRVVKNKGPLVNLGGVAEGISSSSNVKQ